MPESVNPRESGDWTVETLFAHLTALIIELDKRYEQRFIASERANEQRFLAQEQATRKQEHAAEEWRKGANEWREAMTDREQRFMPRAEALQRADANTKTIAELDQRVQNGFAEINSRLDLTSGRSSGLAASWGYVIGLIGIVGGVIAILASLR